MKTAAGLPAHKPYVPDEFEEAGRLIRGFLVVIVVLTFPFVTPQVYYVYFFALMAALYNLARYSPFLLRNKFFASPATVIAIDNLFICLLIALVGTVNTPYSAFLFLMVASSAYRYRLAGVLATIAMQMSLVYLAIRLQLFTTLQLDLNHSIVITLASLLALGFLVERLTRIDKQDRDMFRIIAKENESERLHLMTLIDSLRSAILVVDKAGEVMLHNGAAAALCGVDDSMKGLRLDKVLPLYVRTDPDKERVKIIGSGSEPQHRRDLSLSPLHGRPLDLDITVTPVKLRNSQTTTYVIICEDITHELSLNEQRSEFISVASHELRTPIAIMEAALSTVLHSKEGLPEDTVQIIEQAHANSLLLSGIVKDLAMLSEAKNDNIPIQLEDIDAAKLAKQIVSDFKEQAGKKGLEVAFTGRPNLPAVLSTERHIREILQNYMTNAIKYSNEGMITMHVAATKERGILFSVKDTGIGISPSAQKNLFNKFFRAEDYRTQLVGGTGLGLYLCKELAERLGAKVWCESVLDKGSTFYLEIPPFSGLHRDHAEVTQAQVVGLLEDL